MRITILSLAATFLFMSVHSNASEAELSHSPIISGYQHRVSSPILQQDVRIQVYLPDSYNESEANYPVLYVLDGQWHFFSAVGIQRSLRVPDILPEMIIIGIETEEPIRRSWFGDKRDIFRRSLVSELIPYIESNFRTNKHQIIFGWEMGAFYASYELNSENTPFSGFVASNGGDASQEMLQRLCAKETKNAKHLYLVNSDRDIYTVNYSDQFAQNLAQKCTKNLVWEAAKFNQETHESLPHLAMYEGLKFYFHNYKDLDFVDIAEFEALGGFDYLESYFINRGKRFGFPQDISDSTKNGLIWLSWNHDDFEYFKIFMHRFEDVLKTKRYDSAYWQNRFGRFYLKHGDLASAQNYFERAIVKYPDTVVLHEGMSKTLLASGNRDDAITHLNKAIDIAESTSDPLLKELELALANIQ